MTVDFKVGTLQETHRIVTLDMAAVSNREGFQIDGFLRSDFLREFHSARIDFKNRVLELER